MTTNIDEKVVAGFGDEWSRFDQTALSAEELGRMFDNYFNIFPWDKLPNDFYVMRTDALDRFGTRLEKRFSKDEIRAMMQQAGLENITFSTTSFWTALGYKS